MRTIGVLSTMVSLLFAAVGVALFVRSLPDLRRYLQIRSM